MSFKDAAKNVKKEMDAKAAKKGKSGKGCGGKKC